MAIPAPLPEPFSQGGRFGADKWPISPESASNRIDALKAVMAMIPDGATISRGDSVTLEQIGIIDELKQSKRHKFFDPLSKSEDGVYVLEAEQRLQMQREAFCVDVFLTGTNAITIDGKLVNTDGLGNRVAPLIFGPHKVIVVAGVNKIVQDTTEAIERIHRIAAPMNYWRHYLKHHITEFANLPCVKSGKCANCFHEYKGCLNTVIIEGTYFRVKRRINVVLIGEDLGF